MSCYLETKLQGCNYKEPNEILSEHIPYLKGITKQIIKKLCKQYRIIQISQEPENYCEDRQGRYHIVRRMPIVVKYQHWQTNDPFFKPFEWEFYQTDLQIF